MMRHVKSFRIFENYKYVTHPHLQHASSPQRDDDDGRRTSACPRTRCHEYI